MPRAPPSATNGSVPVPSAERGSPGAGGQASPVQPVPSWSITSIAGPVSIDVSPLTQRSSQANDASVTRSVSPSSVRHTP